MAVRRGLALSLTASARFSFRLGGSWFVALGPHISLPYQTQLTACGEYGGGAQTGWTDDAAGSGADPQAAATRAHDRAERPG